MRPLLAFAGKHLSPASGWRPRFEFFVRRGLLPSVPEPKQVIDGTIAMMSFAFNETPIEFAANRKSAWGRIPLRVPLQLIYCPQQAVVWNGLLATPRTLVKHLCSSFHEDGVIAYDLQLLQSHEGGLELLALEASRVASGTHRWSRMLSAIAGGYHAHLAELARSAQRFEYPADLHPSFSSLVGFGRYCLGLSSSERAAPFPRPAGEGS
jgi:hypothetical protein